MPILKKDLFFVWSLIYFNLFCFSFSCNESNGFEAFITPDHKLTVATFSKKEFCSFTVNSVVLDDGLWVSVFWCIYSSCSNVLHFNSGCILGLGFKIILLWRLLVMHLRGRGGIAIIYSVSHYHRTVKTLLWVRFKTKLYLAILSIFNTILKRFNYF